MHAIAYQCGRHRQERVHKRNYRNSWFINTSKCISLDHVKDRYKILGQFLNILSFFGIYIPSSQSFESERSQVNCFSVCIFSHSICTGELYLFIFLSSRESKGLDIREYESRGPYIRGCESQINDTHLPIPQQLKLQGKLVT